MWCGVRSRLCLVDWNCLWGLHYHLDIGEEELGEEFCPVLGPFCSLKSELGKDRTVIDVLTGLYLFCHEHQFLLVKMHTAHFIKRGVLLPGSLLRSLSSQEDLRWPVNDTLISFCKSDQQLIQIAIREMSIRGCVKQGPVLCLHIACPWSQSPSPEHSKSQAGSPRAMHKASFLFLSFSFSLLINII